MNLIKGHFIFRIQNAKGQNILRTQKATRIGNGNALETQDIPTCVSQCLLYYCVFFNMFWGFLLLLFADNFIKVL